jgi:hypothetical protein
MDNKKVIKFKNNDDINESEMKDLSLTSLGFYGHKSKVLGEIEGTLGCNTVKTMTLRPGEKLVAAKVESRGWMPSRISFLIVDIN